MRAASAARIRMADRVLARRWRAMTGALSPGTRGAVLALIVCCTIFLAGIAAELWFALEIPAASVAPADATPPLRDDDRVPPLPPLRALAEVVERPLFVADRRPAAPAAASADALQPLDLTIAGIILSTTGDRVALLQRRGGNTIVHLHQGQEIDGWKLVAVGTDRAVLERGAVRQELKLRDDPSRTAAHR